MMPRRLPGLRVCCLGVGLGIGLAVVGPLGCAGDGTNRLDSRIFVAPAISETADRSFGAANESVAGVAVAAMDVQAPANADEIPPKAAVLPALSAPTTRPFDAIEPIGELGAGPATQPAQMPATVVGAGGDGIVSQPQTTISTEAIGEAPGINKPAIDIQGQGVYMTLGGVVAQVNDTPIYANQVLAPLKKEFAAKARELSSEEFHQFAEGEIFIQLRERIDDERYFATAFHSLTKEDKELAESHAMMDRHDKIIAAGGSIQQARQKALDAGQDFDAMILKDYRELVFMIYQRRQIEPLIQVSADNMREFYSQNVDKLYSSKAQSQFRVIEIDPDKSDAKLSAKERINGLRARALAGEDFAVLAASENDDSYLKKRAGSPLEPGEWMDRNTYVTDAVEAAIWKIAPGQITPVIESDGKLYLAKLEAKKTGFTKPFEDQTVQADIYSKLRQQQFNRLWQERKDESATQPMVSTDAKRVEVAVEMAMQKYAQLQMVAGQ